MQGRVGNLYAVDFGRLEAGTVAALGFNSRRVSGLNVAGFFFLRLFHPEGNGRRSTFEAWMM